jgi:hypothetical protein
MTGRSTKKGNHIEITRILVLDEAAVEPLEAAIEPNRPERRAMAKPTAKDRFALICGGECGRDFDSRHDVWRHVLGGAAGSGRSDVGRQDPIDRICRNWHGLLRRGKQDEKPLSRLPGYSSTTQTSVEP